MRFSPPWHRSHAQCAHETSHMRCSDLFHEIWVSIAVRPARTLMAICGSMVAIASLIIIIGSVQTASGQISTQFDELASTLVRVKDDGPKQNKEAMLSFPEHARQRVEALNGSTGAMLYWACQAQSSSSSSDSSISITKRPLSESEYDTTAQKATVYASDDGLPDIQQDAVAQGKIFDDYHIQTHAKVVVLGSKLAQQLGIMDFYGSPQIYINNVAFTVMGTLHDIDTVPSFNTGLLMPYTTAIDLYGNPTKDSPAQMLTITQMGATALIARQIAYALRPDAPTLFTITKPAEWTYATQSVKDSMSGLLVALLVITLVISCISIANTTLHSVSERTREIGLRRAMGAKSVHIAVQIMFETCLLGIIGGVFGMSFGLAGLLAMCGIQHWTPVLDTTLLLFGPLLGMITGILAGLYPAFRASRISPISALRSE